MHYLSQCLLFCCFVFGFSSHAFGWENPARGTGWENPAASSDSAWKNPATEQGGGWINPAAPQRNPATAPSPQSASSRNERPASPAAIDSPAAASTATREAAKTAGEITQTVREENRPPRVNTLRRAEQENTPADMEAMRQGLSHENANALFMGGRVGMSVAEYAGILTASGYTLAGRCGSTDIYTGPGDLMYVLAEYQGNRMASSTLHTAGDTDTASRKCLASAAWVRSAAGAPMIFGLKIGMAAQAVDNALTSRGLMRRGTSNQYADRGGNVIIECGFRDSALAQWRMKSKGVLPPAFKTEINMLRNGRNTWFYSDADVLISDCRDGICRDVTVREHK